MIPSGPLLGVAAEGGGEIGQAERRCRSRGGSPFGSQTSRGLREAREELAGLLLAQQVVQMAVDGEALGRQAPGGGHHLRPGELAELAGGSS